MFGELFGGHGSSADAFAAHAAATTDGLHGWAHRPHDPEAYFGKLMGMREKHAQAGARAEDGEVDSVSRLRHRAAWSLREGGLV